MDVQRRSQTRSPKRSHEACLNCRRKKQRCPGEKPSCSSCTRLSQECVYRSNERRKTAKTHMEKRLAHIEHQLSWILKDKRTDEPENDSHEQGSRSPSEESSQPLLRSPPVSTVEKALCLYFEYCHLQPLCCLNREILQNPSSLPDELVHALLTLTSHFTTEIVEAQYHLSTARTLIMLRIANGTVDFAVLQSLALISYSYFLDGEFQLGQFHLGLALQLCRSTFMDHQSTYRIGSVDCEARSTVFWTFQMLEQFYGCQSGLLQIPTQIWRSSCLSSSSSRQTDRTDSEDVVLLPQLLDNPPRSAAVWGQIVQLGWIWSMVRKYVADAASNNISEPWLLNSSYARTVADLMEVETAVPTCHRYDTVKFYQRQPQELREDQDYWKPWLLLQFTYHAAHTMLNHPFLYLAVSQQNQSFARPNTFWRKSMDSVLLHATWITRIIDMVLEKQVRLTDLCFANFAALAATVHMYYCCAADDRLRSKSRADLAKCLSFLNAFTTFSPPCQILESKLLELLRIASGSEMVDLAVWTPLKICLDAKLMWETIGLICQITWGPKPFQGLLHASFQPSASQVYGENLTFEVTITTSPEVTVQIADGGQAAPITNAAGAAQVATPHNTDEQEQNIALIMNECLEPNLPWLWQPAAQEVESGRIGNQDIATPMGGDLWDSHWWSSGNL